MPARTATIGGWNQAVGSGARGERARGLATAQGG
jgi:hypothetical protein